MPNLWTLLFTLALARVRRSVAVLDAAALPGGRLSILQIGQRLRLLAQRRDDHQLRQLQQLPVSAKVRRGLVQPVAAGHGGGSAGSVVGLGSRCRFPKTGPPYTGGHTDPGLNDATQCPDAILEPNDGPDPGGPPARRFTPTPDTPTAKIIKLAICPTGKP